MRFSDPKLTDCHEHGSRSELYVVEGDSAARTLVRICDRRHQAVFPMQGKPMNAIKATASSIFRNRQFAELIKALGVDISMGISKGQPPKVDLRKMRYEKIILLFDPDADGIHGRTLMLFFFYRWMRSLLDAGRVFDAHVPQWVVTGKGMSEPVYATTPEYLKKVRTYLKEKGITEVRTKRFRGLGSVDGHILQQQCVDDTTRTLHQLTVEHAENALAMFENMGPTR